MSDVSNYLYERKQRLFLALCERSLNVVCSKKAGWLPPIDKQINSVPVPGTRISTGYRYQNVNASTFFRNAFIVDQPKLKKIIC
jgi:hypothetical protein